MSLRDRQRALRDAVKALDTPQSRPIEKAVGPSAGKGQDPIPQADISPLFPGAKSVDEVRAQIATLGAARPNDYAANQRLNSILREVVSSDPFAIRELVTQTCQSRFPFYGEEVRTLPENGLYTFDDRFPNTGQRSVIETRLNDLVGASFSDYTANAQLNDLHQHVSEYPGRPLVNRLIEDAYLLRVAKCGADPLPTAPPAQARPSAAELVSRIIQEGGGDPSSRPPPRRAPTAAPTPAPETARPRPPTAAPPPAPQTETARPLPRPVLPPTTARPSSFTVLDDPAGLPIDQVVPTSQPGDITAMLVAARGGDPKLLQADMARMRREVSPPVQEPPVLPPLETARPIPRPPVAPPAPPQQADPGATQRVGPVHDPAATQRIDRMHSPDETTFLADPKQCQLEFTIPGQKTSLGNDWILTYEGSEHKRSVFSFTLSSPGRRVSQSVRLMLNETTYVDLTDSSTGRAYGRLGIALTKYASGVKEVTLTSTTKVVPLTTSEKEDAALNSTSEHYRSHRTVAALLAGFDVLAGAATVVLASTTPAVGLAVGVGLAILEIPIIVSTVRTTKNELKRVAWAKER